MHPGDKYLADMSGTDVEDEKGNIIILEDMILYPKFQDTTFIDEALIYGRVIEDTCVFTSGEHRTIVDPLEFLGITNTDPSSVNILQMPGTGYIGMAPHTKDKKDYNFMYNLKENG
jgi:hypothetical protein